MTHEFEISEEITLDATPEQVWDAIATGPGVDSWFMGHSEIEPREGGVNRLDMMGFVQESTITTWDPGKRLAFRGTDASDGTFMAFEYLIEGRDGGSSVLRFVHSGILGDDWEAQYDALKEGDPMYLAKLAVYLKYFKGRTARHNMFLPGPRATDVARVWPTFAAALSLSGPITEGAQVRFDVPGLPPTEGVVEFVSEPHFVGVRSADGIHMLIQGYEHSVVAEYHGFSDDEDEKEIESAWQTWLNATFV
jgi:uncharacterized protein YndB with AHSA1/START domain